MYPGSDLGSGVTWAKLNIRLKKVQEHNPEPEPGFDGHIWNYAVIHLGRATVLVFESCSVIDTVVQDGAEIREINAATPSERRPRRAGRGRTRGQRACDSSTASHIFTRACSLLEETVPMMDGSVGPAVVTAPPAMAPHKERYFDRVDGSPERSFVSSLRQDFSLMEQRKRVSMILQSPAIQDTRWKGLQCFSSTTYVAASIRKLNFQFKDSSVPELCYII
ncbi:alpha-adducin-like [Arapaima gigas]